MCAAAVFIHMKGQMVKKRKEVKRAGANEESRAALSIVIISERSDVDGRYENRSNT